MTLETLDTLISGENEYSNAEINMPKGWDNAHTKPNSAPITFPVLQSNVISQDTSSTAVGEGFQLKPNSHLNKARGFGPLDSVDTPPERDEHFGPDAAGLPSSRPPFPRDQRTILFTNLSDRTTHQDLVNIIRGGRLLDIYIRNDRSATVSFVEGAQEFLAYAKRNDFYIHAKRVEVRWHDRQFNLPNHVANKISIGATRNLVIRGAAGKLTKEGIREDLDHIHNLVVIGVKFRDGDVYVSTNSVHNALFARTCMMSRTEYKGLRIEWYPDECAAPLSKVPARSWKDHLPVPRPGAATIVAPVTNRFALLNTDGTESGSDDEEDTKDFSGYGVRHDNWADAGLVA